MASDRRSDARASRAPTNVIRDLTRPIARDAQLVRRRRLRWPLALAGTAVVAALVYALFAVPYGNLRRQQDQIGDKRAELAVLAAANDQLAREVARLRTADGAEEAARAELAVLAPGEHRVAVLPGPSGALPLPAGWPFDIVAQIVAVRSQNPAPIAPTDAAPTDADAPDPATDPAPPPAP